MLLIEPGHLHEARGNAVTVARWAASLQAAGVAVERCAAPGTDSAASDPLTAPDVIHAHHGGHCGPWALDLKRRFNVPLVISLGGTDLNGPGGGLDPRAVEPLARADAVVGPFEQDGRRLTALLGARVRYFVVRRGVRVPESPLALPPQGALVRAVMVGAVRRIKGQLAALEWLTRLRALGVPWRLDVYGPVAEADYADEFRRAVATTSGAAWHGVVDNEHMATVWSAADLLLNASESEGASNAILEALAAGRPVAARDVPGNREQLIHAPSGVACLFEADEGGMRRLGDWLREFSQAGPAARAERSALAHSWARARFDSAIEIRELRAVYRFVLENRPGSAGTR